MRACRSCRWFRLAAGESALLSRGTRLARPKVMTPSTSLRGTCRPPPILGAGHTTDPGGVTLPVVQNSRGRHPRLLTLLPRRPDVGMDLVGMNPRHAGYRQLRQRRQRTHRNHPIGSDRVEGVGHGSGIRLDRPHRSAACRSAVRGQYRDELKGFASRLPKPLSAPEDAPNVLLIMGDDIGYGRMGAFGGPRVHRCSTGWRRMD